MKTIKVSDATGEQLGWLVAKCWWHDEFDRNRIWLTGGKTRILNNPAEFPESWTYSVEWSPTEDWAQGGPIIERESICLDYWNIPPTPAHWTAGIAGTMDSLEGPTPLIAAMRCFVASKLGDEVEVPEELT